MSIILAEENNASTCVEPAVPVPDALTVPEYTVEEVDQVGPNLHYQVEQAVIEHINSAIHDDAGDKVLSLNPKEVHSENELERDKIKTDMQKDYSRDSEIPSMIVGNFQKRSSTRVVIRLSNLIYD
ncbi:uncharacterized protein LOC122292737 [Carya illinoinensis]|uniref:uncharacterized protein LOC122292737 n=1 Tax=Carya illinoinensis TaxID=32201 RepID=UPI001C71ED3A|nr:uncharacterized protein LOC122292737 [Carya illinoinensis]